MLEFYGIIENGLLKTILLSSFGQIQAFFNSGLLLAFNNASHHQHSLSNHLHIFLFSYITDITAYTEQFYFFIFAVVKVANFFFFFFFFAFTIDKIPAIF